MFRAWTAIREFATTRLTTWLLGLSGHGYSGRSGRRHGSGHSGSEGGRVRPRGGKPAGHRGWSPNAAARGRVAQGKAPPYRCCGSLDGSISEPRRLPAWTQDWQQCSGRWRVR
ncbi:hypothetical protein ADK75_08405 [Streptomyces virginiae]|uniref:Uncharacterized protein n=1 Tax=Streptomyces virginiae TaxID=1961 RepID=A0A0L8N0K4_STRVG|nr:hypothetical protein ADK75_08405 [Streptomyces virginiae]